MSREKAQALLQAKSIFEGRIEYNRNLQEAIGKFNQAELEEYLYNFNYAARSDIEAARGDLGLTKQILGLHKNSLLANIDSDVKEIEEALRLLSGVLNNESSMLSFLCFVNKRIAFEQRNLRKNTVAQKNREAELLKERKKEARRDRKHGAASKSDSASAIKKARREITSSESNYTVNSGEMSELIFFQQAWDLIFKDEVISVPEKEFFDFYYELSFQPGEDAFFTAGASARFNRGQRAILEFQKALITVESEAWGLFNKLNLNLPAKLEKLSLERKEALDLQKARVTKDERDFKENIVAYTTDQIKLEEQYADRYALIKLMEFFNYDVRELALKDPHYLILLKMLNNLTQQYNLSEKEKPAVIKASATISTVEPKAPDVANIVSTPSVTLEISAQIQAEAAITTETEAATTAETELERQQKELDAELLAIDAEIRRIIMEKEAAKRLEYTRREQAALATQQHAVEEAQRRQNASGLLRDEVIIKYKADLLDLFDVKTGIKYREVVSIVNKLGGEVDDSKGSSHVDINFGHKKTYINNPDHGAGAASASASITKKEKKNCIGGVSKPHNGEVALNRWDFMSFKKAIKAILPENWRDIEPENEIKNNVSLSLTCS